MRNGAPVTARQRILRTARTPWFAAAVMLTCAVVAIAAVYLQYQQRAARIQVAVADCATGTEYPQYLSSGTGSDIVDVYTALPCPACQQFAASKGQELLRRASRDEIELRIHPVVLDNPATVTNGELHVGQPPQEIARWFAMLGDQAQNPDAGQYADHSAAMAQDIDESSAQPSEDFTCWIVDQTYRNRERVGRVPAVFVDGQRVSVEDV